MYHVKPHLIATCPSYRAKCKFVSIKSQGKPPTQVFGVKYQGLFGMRKKTTGTKIGFLVKFL